MDFYAFWLALLVFIFSPKIKRWPFAVLQDNGNNNNTVSNAPTRTFTVQNYREGERQTDTRNGVLSLLLLSLTRFLVINIIRTNLAMDVNSIFFRTQNRATMKLRHQKRKRSLNRTGDSPAAKKLAHDEDIVNGDTDSNSEFSFAEPALSDSSSSEDSIEDETPNSVRFLSGHKTQNDAFHQYGFKFQINRIFIGQKTGWLLLDMSQDMQE